MIWLGVLISRRVARGDSFTDLYKVMVASVVLHILCAPGQILVVDHFYGGVADWTRYVHQGALLSSNWRNGHFMIAGSGIHGLLGDGAVSIAGGVIMTVFGPDKLAAFFVSAWLAFVGTVFFYRAFAVTFPEANRKRYALLVLLFPSLLFWTADVSKESIMLVAFGLAAYGMALILRSETRGYLYAVLGGALALVIRPNELVVLVIGFAVAMLVRAVSSRDPSRPRNPIRMVAAFVFVAGAVVVTGIYASHFVHALGGSGLSTNTLSTLRKNNQGAGAGFGSSNVAFSSNPLWYPRDIYTVLFDPLPFSAHSVTQLFAALENLLILAVILLSFRQLRHLLRASIQRPYVLAALFFTAVHIYAFAALGNLGLITRERTLVLPFLFVALAIPIAQEGEVPYPWQLRRGLRLMQRRIRAAGFLAGEDTDADSVAVWAGETEEWATGPVDAVAEDWVTSDWVTSDWVPEP
jgi:hypothetical protein